MRKLIIPLLILLFSSVCFAQMPRAAMDTSVAVGHFVAPTVSLGLSDRTSVTVERYAEHGTQGFLTYRFADVDINGLTTIQAHVLLGGASDGFMGGFVFGQPKYKSNGDESPYYWNVLLGNVYRIAGGVAVPGRYSNWLSLEGETGTRGYSGAVVAKLVRRPFLLCNGLTGFAGYAEDNGVFFGLRTTLVLSE